MKRATLNLVIDFVSFAILASMIATGLLVRFVLPPGSRGGRGLSLWSLDRHDWGDIHFWLAVSLIGILLVHLALHWSWVCQVARIALGAPRGIHRSNIEMRRTVVGVSVVAGLAVLIAAFLFFASANVSHAGAGSIALERAEGESSMGLRTNQDSSGMHHQRRFLGSLKP